MDVLCSIAAGKDKTNVFTQLLADKDAIRDAAFIALRDYVKAKINRTDMDAKAAAELLTNIFR